MYSRTKNYKFLFFLLLASLVSFFLSSRLVLQDLTIYWAATIKFFSSENPYGLPLISSYASGSVGNIDPGNTPLQAWIPPFAFIPLFPLSLFSLQFAKFLYILLVIIFFGYWFSKYIKHLKSFFVIERISFKLLLFSLSVFLGMILFFVLLFGGITWIFYIAAIGLSGYHLKADRKFLAGFFLFPFFFKLQFFVCLLVSITIAEALKKDFKFLIGVTISGLLLIFSSFLLNSNSYEYYDPNQIIKFLEGYIYITNFLGKTVSILDVSLNQVTLICLFISVVTGVFWGNRCSKFNIDIAQQFFITIPISISLSPYGWNHDCAILIPSYVILSSCFLDNKIQNSRDAFVYSFLLVFGLVSFAFHYLPFSSMLLLLLNVYVSEKLLRIVCSKGFNAFNESRV